MIQPANSEEVSIGLRCSSTVDKNSLNSVRCSLGISPSPYDIDRFMTNLAPVYNHNGLKEERVGRLRDRCLTGHELLDDKVQFQQ